MGAKMREGRADFHCGHLGSWRGPWVAEEKDNASSHHEPVHNEPPQRRNDRQKQGRRIAGKLRRVVDSRRDQRILRRRSRGCVGNERVDCGIGNCRKQAGQQAVGSKQHRRKAKCHIGHAIKRKGQREGPGSGGKGQTRSDPVSQSPAGSGKEQERSQLQRLEKADLAGRKPGVECHVPHHQNGLETFAAMPEPVGAEEVAAHDLPIAGPDTRVRAVTSPVRNFCGNL